MRHGNVNRKFGRKTDERRALMRSLMRSLIEKGRITTTEARAKEVRPAVEKLLTRAKQSTVANRRMLLSALGSEAVVSKLMTTAQSYSTRAGGYVRIVKMAPRKGDAARMALIEFV